MLQKWFLAAAGSFKLFLQKSLRLPATSVYSIEPLLLGMGLLWNGKENEGSMKAVLLFFYLYHFVIFMISLVFPRTRIDYSSHQCKNRFVIIIPAHNEENVIYESVRSIMNLRYPRNLYDVFVIADNCNDKTAELAIKAGARVLKRHDDNLRGKQHALKWAFENIDLDNYDAVVVLDADNHVDPSFLLAMDSQLQKGNNVTQGYIETKNPYDSWITVNYAYMYWYICRLQIIRTKLGLSAWLGGTGWCIRTSTLKKTGWKVETMTDDLEYTCQLILKGERVVFADDAIVYDQKPANMLDSIRQRVRWIRGQNQVSLKYIPAMLISIATFWWQGRLGNMVRSIDAVMWLPMHIVILACFCISTFSLWFNYFFSILLTVPVFYILPMVSEKVKNIKAWLYLVTSGAFFATWIPITAYGVITCGNKRWWRTPH